MIALLLLFVKWHLLSKNDNIVYMQTITKQKKNNKKPILENEEKRLIWKKAKGIWKNRKPDPIKELNKIRRGWNR